MRDIEDNIVGFSSPSEGNDHFFITLEDDNGYRKGDCLLLNGGKISRTVKKVYRRTWWTLLIDRFATYLKNKTRITDIGTVIEIRSHE